MECLEFKRLALSDPNSTEANFVEHAENCPCCLKYIGGVREMDANLAASLDVNVPGDLLARLELNQIEEQDKKSGTRFSMYAKAAGLAAIMFVSGFFLKDTLFVNPPADTYVSHGGASQVTEGMVVKVVEHMEKYPLNPIWGAEKANKSLTTLLASYDPTFKLKNMSRLQFSKICAMDEEHDALHGNLETDHGQITFAYIKGHPVGEVSNTSYKGYLTRVKPIRSGSLVIISHNMYAMEEADQELESAMHWDL